MSYNKITNNDAGKKLNILIDGNEIDWVAGDGLPFITKHNTINGFNVILYSIHDIT
jgi:hypothetical protein